MPTFKTIPLEQIRSTAKNPRSDLAEDEDLQGLAASLGSEADPQLVEPPVVEAVAGSEYRILAGERRIQAARLAGWKQIPCLVHEPLDPSQAHTMRLVENLHRQALHPLDQAAALKIAWLSANADESGLGEQSRQVLDLEQPPAATLSSLQDLLAQNGFVPTHPAVTWDALLDRLGIEMTPARRKRLLSVLGIEANVQERLRDLEITEASLRALGQLERADQEKLVEAIEADAGLASKVRRIAHAVNHHDYALQDALDEAQGNVILGHDHHDHDHHHDHGPEVDDSAASEEERLMDTVVALLEIANQWDEIIGTLNELAGGNPWKELPEPWGEYADQAYRKIKDAIEKGSRHVL